MPLCCICQVYSDVMMPWDILHSSKPCRQIDHALPFHQISRELRHTWGMSMSSTCLVLEQVNAKEGSWWHCTKLSYGGARCFLGAHHPGVTGLRLSTQSSRYRFHPFSKEDLPIWAALLSAPRFAIQPFVETVPSLTW